MLSTFLVVAFCIGNAFGSPAANQYIKNVIDTALQRELNDAKLNPAIIPGFMTKFEVKVPIIGKVKGEAEYSRGTLIGLAQVRNYSECQGPYFNSGLKSIVCTIGFDDLQLTYEGKLKYGKLPKVNIKGISHLKETAISIEVSSRTDESKAHLSSFVLTQIGGLEVKFIGLGPLNKYTKFLESDYRYHAQNDINFYITRAFKDVLENAVASVPLPN